MSSLTGCTADRRSPSESQTGVGALTVAASTTGDSLDPDGYTVRVDGGSHRSIAINDSTTYSDLSAGDHEVQLSGMASNCTVSGSNPRTVSVPEGDTASTTFEIACSEPGGGGAGSVTGVSWQCSSLVTGADGSDLWPITWSDDGHQYAAWGDGTGFDGSDRVGGGTARLEGSPTSFSATELGDWSAGGGGPYPDSFLSLDGILYLMVNNNAGADELWKSTDKAATWTTDVISFDHDSEIIPTFLISMGQNQAAAVDQYVYITAVEWGASDAGPFLMRVPEAEIENKAAYEVFTGTSETPSWSSNINLGGPGVRIHDWPGQINYLPPIDKWLLFESGSGYGGESGGSRNDMGIFKVHVADAPYGPWTEIYDAEGNWCGWAGQSTTTVLGKFIAPAWIGSVSNNQLPFWMVFSGTGTWDRFNTINGIATVD